MSRRVAVTGMGVLSALGDELGDFWKAISEGKCGIRPLEDLPLEELRLKTGAQLQNRPEAGELDPFARYFLDAGRAALADSGLELSEELRSRTAVVSGTAGGGQWTLDREFQRLYGGSRPRVHPTTVARFMNNAGASHLSMDLGLTGPVWTVSTACSSATQAIGQAYWMVRTGNADLAIAGGSEAPFSLGYLKAWEAMRVVAPDVCRPFSRGRKGMSLGEGAGVLILEPLPAALARGARCYGEIVGFGMSSDAAHLTRPQIEGPARAMRAALFDAGKRVEEVGYINAHGTGTPLNDTVECAAIHQVFGPHATSLKVSSTKSMHGHALGAAGGLEAVATLQALHRQLAPPTVNFLEPDPDCSLNVVPNQAQSLETSVALSNSFAFGGLNAVLAFASI